MNIDIRYPNYGAETSRRTIKRPMK